MSKTRDIKPMCGSWTRPKENILAILWHKLCKLSLLCFLWNHLILFLSSHCTNNIHCSNNLLVFICSGFFLHFFGINGAYQQKPWIVKCRYQKLMRFKFQNSWQEKIIWWDIADDYFFSICITNSPLPSQPPDHWPMVPSCSAGCWYQAFTERYAMHRKTLSLSFGPFIICFFHQHFYFLI